MSTLTLNNLSIATAGVTLFALATVNPSLAAVLTFDDLSTTASAGVLPTGYGGFQWTNFGYIKGSALYPGGSGYTNGAVSGKYVAYNGSGEPAIVVSRNQAFDFTGAYLTGAWENQLQVTVAGLLKGVQQFSQTVTVDTKKPTWFNFNFIGIDQLTFSPSGGQPAGYKSPQGGTFIGDYFAMDDFTYTPEEPPIEEPPKEPVPEPTTILGSLAFGVMSLAARYKRK